MLTDKELYAGFQTPLDKEPSQMIMDRKLIIALAAIHWSRRISTTRPTRI